MNKPISPKQPVKKNVWLTVLIKTLCFAPSTSLLCIDIGSQSERLIIMTAALMGGIAVYHLIQTYLLPSMYSIEELDQQLRCSRRLHIALFVIFCIIVASVLGISWYLLSYEEFLRQQAHAIAAQTPQTPAP
jgi:hypothetical protein